MRGRALFVFALAAFFAPWAVFAQHTLEIIEESGDSSNRIDLVVMGDGYTAAEQVKLVSDTEDALDGLFGHPPFDSYEPFFNLARIKTVSNESGADHPGDGTYVDSYFGCYYDCMGIERLICCEDTTVQQTLSQQYPAWDVAILVVNDSEYGGSGGSIAIFSTDPWSVDGVAHEFGHTLGKLADEYEDEYPGFVFQDIYPNVSPTADREDLKWTIWVDETTLLPTLESAALTDLSPVGAYEGACYQSTGLYRPVLNCLMRTLGKEMCPICSQALVLSFYEFVEPVDSYFPAEASVSGGGSDEIDFIIDAVEPEDPTVTYTWTLDGDVLDEEDGDTLVFIMGELAAGEHALSVKVKDETPLVRSDPDGLMEQTISWTLTSSGGDMDTDSDADDDDNDDSDDDDDAADDDDDDTADDDDDDDTADDGDADDDDDDDDDGCGCNLTKNKTGLLELIASLLN